MVRICNYSDLMKYFYFLIITEIVSLSGGSLSTDAFARFN